VVSPSGALRKQEPKTGRRQR